MEYETHEDAEKAVCVLHDFEFRSTMFVLCFALMLVDLMQILELNDERNWRNGLRSRLLNTCMVDTHTGIGYSYIVSSLPLIYLMLICALVFICHIIYK